MASFQTSSFSVLLALSLTFFLLLLSKVNSSEDLSFRFTKFEKGQQNLIFQGDATVASGKLRLTKVENSIPLPNSLGRVLYATPVHIWDEKTGNVASFATSFSFVIDALNPTDSADGIAFFIAPVDTQPGRPHGYLGIFNGSSYNSSYQTVAVEFDTYSNRWDPKGRHIGIDVNWIESQIITPWEFKNKHPVTVGISYQAHTKTLVVHVVHPVLNTTSTITADVDLKSVVPEYVRVGFSATSAKYAQYAESHDVLSWSFESKLADGSSGVAKDNVDLASSMVDDSMDLVTY